MVRLGHDFVRHITLVQHMHCMKSLKIHGGGLHVIQHLYGLIIATASRC